jgi:hypothetical protein
VATPAIISDLFLDQTDEGRDEWLTPEDLLDLAQDHALNEWSSRDYKIFKTWRAKSERDALAAASKWLRQASVGPDPKRVCARWLKASVPVYDASYSDWSAFQKWGNAPHSLSKRFQGTITHLHIPKLRGHFPFTYETEAEALKAGQKAVSDYVSGMGYARDAEVWKIIKWPEGYKGVSGFSPLLTRSHSGS